MKSKFQKKKDREKRVKRKLLIRREAATRKRKEVNDFRKEEKALEKAQKQPSAELKMVLDKLAEMEEETKNENS